MKKLNLLSLFGLLAAAFTARADINNTNIYIVNNTKENITVSQPKQEESVKESSRRGGKTKSKDVGQALIVKPNDKIQVASLGRDQYFHTMDWGLRSLLYGKAYSKKTTISFVTNNKDTHRFESEWVDRKVGSSSGSDMTSRLTYSYRSTTPGSKEVENVNPPYVGNGFGVYSKFKFPYHDVEMIFDPNIKP